MNKSYISRSKKWRRTLIYFSFVPLIGYAYTQNTNKMNCASSHEHSQQIHINTRTIETRLLENNDIYFAFLKLKGVTCTQAAHQQKKKKKRSD